MISHAHISRESPVYIRLLYKLINVINRPSRIAWESVFCTETVSILNEREGERKRESKGEREISTFFLLHCSFPHPHLPTLSCSAECVEKVWCSTISTNTTEKQRYRFWLFVLMGIEPRSTNHYSSQTLGKGAFRRSLLIRNVILWALSK